MIRLGQSDPLEAQVDAAAEAMLRGETVVLPTDTVYGLAADPRRPEAVARIFAMKGRPAGRNLPVIVTGAQQARELGVRWTDPADRLARAFWPGGLTIAIGIEEPPDWLEGRVEVGLRAPDHALIQGIAERVGPFVMTSANRHRHVTPASLDEALDDLVAPPAVAIDGGTLPVVSSTLVNVNLPVPEIERGGVIARAAIEEVLADVRA
ncbi:MAG TPA: L-threonylcarbamoyladenylate synthase [Solirubrobacteraceae bacterium]|jgi:L-threonylcarbamoyladenylate synthase